MKVALLFRRATTDELKEDDLIGRSGLETVRAVSNSLKELGHMVEVINPEDFKKMFNNHFDIAFNLCDDGFFDNSHLEPHIPALLDILKIPYTGSDYFSLALCLDKYKTKQILSYHKIPTPKSQIFETGREKLDKNLRFPLIVKPSREDASIGIHNDSVIRKKSDLKPKIFKLLSRYNQPILVEEYIDGRELNVGIIGNEKPLILPLSEIMFNLPTGMNKICSYEAKWVTEHASYNGTKPNCPARVSKKLGKRLIELALKSYKLMGCRDYGRVDFRVDCFGRPFVLEVNPNPDISQSAGLANMSSKAGLSYTQLIGKIIDSAVERMKFGEKR